MPSARVAHPVPDFELRTIRDPDERITPAIFRQHEYSLLNVWATWCVACRVEHPFFVELVEREGVPIYGINYKDDVAAAQRWLEELHDPYVLSVVDQDGRLGLDLGDRKSTRLNSSHVAISYAVFCLKKKNKEMQHIGI